ncbi:hypothetical protein T01_2011 [Trichinella spiralis]|uniref:Uncharacterized protein n=1 Tax=Trichinella spiralis TaxID=6334 RepID=A0A0V1BSR8_TRISP|nr:hypothetical protein T01_2011 [Trichinella spiralis]
MKTYMIPIFSNISVPIFLIKQIAAYIDFQELKLKAIHDVEQNKCINLKPYFFVRNRWLNNVHSMPTDRLKCIPQRRKRIQSITTDILERCNQKFLDKGLRRPGIEPGSPAWQASILPLNHRRCCDIRSSKKPFIGREIIHCYYTTRRSLK